MEFCTSEDITNALPLGQQDIDSSLGALNLNKHIADAASYIASALNLKYQGLIGGDGVLKKICIGLVLQEIAQYLNTEQMDGFKQANFDNRIKSAREDLQALIDGSLTLPTTAYTSKTSTVRLNGGFTVLTDEELAAQRML